MYKIALLLFYLLFSLVAECQDSTFTMFTYGSTGSGVRFSMQVPSSWKAVDENDGTGYFQKFYDTGFVPAKKSKNCLDSAVYRLRYIPGNLSHAMAELGFRDKGNNLYMIEMNGYISVVAGFETKGQTFAGLDCSFRSNAICNGKVKKAAADMHYLLFSNGEETVCIVNNGIDLPRSTAERLISSFRFD